MKGVRELGADRATHGRKLRRSKYHSVLLTGTLLVAAGLGAGFLIFPDRLLSEPEWAKPSAAWSVVFPEQSVPSRVYMASMERAPAAAPPQEVASRPVAAPALIKMAVDHPATTANTSPIKGAARDLPWLPEPGKSAEAPTSEAVQIAPRVAVASPEVVPTVPVPRASPPAPLTEEVAELMKRARGHIDMGDIAGARLLLERAAAGREPNALMALAETYDPAMLVRWGARGLKGDLGKARNLYQAAAESGLAEARTRVLAVR